MDRLLFFFAGGEAFWWSLPPLILLLVVAAVPWQLRGGVRAVVVLAFVVTGVFVFLGGPPVSAWIYGLWIFATVALVAVLKLRPATRKWPAWIAVAFVSGLALFLAVEEWRYSQRMNSLPAMEGRKVYVIGDSLSAGIGAEGRAWPQVLAEDEGWFVENLAIPGARVRTAYESQAPRVETEGAVVILMIGGNDLVARVDPDEFERDLGALIEALAVPGRLLVMVELPAIPGYRAYPRAQRKLANRDGIILIPRRHLARVLSRPGATVDGIHFSDRGHEQWAATLVSLRER